MPLISAAQLIYTNIEEDASRQGRGFQTLCCTKDRLSKTDISDLEARLVYQPSGVGGNKKTFFVLSGQRAVVANICPLEGTDRYSRTGRYFAHALIFSSNDFLQLNNNPLIVFDTFQFWTKVEQALNADERQNDNIPPASFAFNSPSEAFNNDNSFLLNEEIYQFLLLAAQANRLKDDKKAIAAIGNTTDMLSMLRTIFDVLPPSLRIHCSFDTLFAQSLLSRLHYWMIGVPPGEGKPSNTIDYDLAQHIFTRQPPYAPVGLYEEWIATQPQYSYEPTKLRTKAEQAFWLNELHQGQPVPLAVNCLYNNLQTSVGANLSKHLYPTVQKWFSSQNDLSMPLDLPFSVTHLTQWILDVFSASNKPPSVEELQGLERLTSRENAPLLHLLYVYWTNQKDQLLAAFLQLSHDDLKLEPVRQPLTILAHSQLDKQVGPILSELLVQDAVTWVQEHGKEGLAVLGGGFSKIQLHKWVEAWLNNFANDPDVVPTSKQIEALSFFSNISIFPLAQIACAYWQQRWSDLAAPLSVLEPIQFTNPLVRKAAMKVLLQRFRAEAGETLGTRLFETFRKGIEKQKGKLHEIVQKDISADQWAQWITGTFQPDAKPPDQSELIEIERLVQKYNIPVVQVLCLFWKGKTSEAVNQLGVVSEEHFKQPALRPVINQWLQMRLEKQVGIAIASNIVASASNWVFQSPSNLRKIQEGYDDILLLRWTYEAYGSNITLPSSEELASIKLLLDKAESLPSSKFVYSLNDAQHNIFIEMKLYMWRWDKQWDNLAHAVWFLTPDEYNQFSKWAVETTSPIIERGATLTKRGLLSGYYWIFTPSAEQESHSLIWSLFGQQQNIPEMMLTSTIESEFPFLDRLQQKSLEMKRRCQQTEGYLHKRAKLLSDEKKIQSREKNKAV